MGRLAADGIETSEGEMPIQSLPALESEDDDEMSTPADVLAGSMARTHELVTKTGLRSQVPDNHEWSTMCTRVASLQEQYLSKYYQANRVFFSDLPLAVEVNGRRRILTEDDLQ
jgi:hypothetical protein